MKRVAGLAGLLLALGVLAGCGGGDSSPANVAPGLRGIYTVNGGGGMNVDGTASFIATGNGNQVTLRVFDVGKVPNYMVIRGTEGYIVNSLSNNVQIVNLSTGTTVGTVSTGANSNPMKLALAPDGTAYVTNLMANNVAVIDLAGRRLVRTVDVSSAGSGPTGVAVAGGKVYVTLTNMVFDGQSVSYGPGKVAVIPVGGTQVTKTITVPINPQDAVADGSGLVHVSCTGNYADVPGRIAIINPGTDTVQRTVELGGAPGNLTVTPAGRVFVADATRGVMAYSATTGIVLFGPEQAITRPNASILDVRYDPQTGLVYAADFQGDRVIAVDPVSGAVRGEFTVGNGPTAIGVFPQ